MNQKKAKSLKRLAAKFVQENPNSDKRINWYKRLKKSYKQAKGHI